MKKAIAAEQNNYIDIFKDTLVEYNIIYDRLKIFKSGAICIPYDNNKILDKYAVGFSHNIYEKHIADKIALEGCKIMKKKLISYDCKCEIIL